MCGAEVDELRARAVAIVDGRVHYFCCAEHKASFLKDPAHRAAPVVVEKERPPRPRKASLPPVAIKQAQAPAPPPAATAPEKDDAAAVVTRRSSSSGRSKAADILSEQTPLPAVVRPDPPSVEISYERSADAATDEAEPGEQLAAPPEARRASIAIILVITVALAAMGVILLLIRH